MIRQFEKIVIGCQLTTFRQDAVGLSSDKKKIKKHGF